MKARYEWEGKTQFYKAKNINDVKDLMFKYIESNYNMDYNDSDFKPPTTLDNAMIYEISENVESINISEKVKDLINKYEENKKRTKEIQTLKKLIKKYPNITKGEKNDI